MGAKTTKNKKLEGTYRADRAPKNEVIPKEVDELDINGQLVNEFADKIWMKLNRNLSDMGMLNEIDQESLMAYCNQMGIYFDCMEKVKQEGYTTISPANGEIISNYMKIGNDALKIAMSLSDKFGFNPAARTKIEMPIKKPKDKGVGGLL